MNTPYCVRFMQFGRVHYVHCENQTAATIVATALRDMKTIDSVYILHGMVVIPIAA